MPAKKRREQERLDALKRAKAAGMSPAQFEAAQAATAGESEKETTGEKEKQKEKEKEKKKHGWFGSGKKEGEPKL